MKIFSADSYQQYNDKFQRFASTAKDNWIIKLL